MAFCAGRARAAAVLIGCWPAWAAADLATFVAGDAFFNDLERNAARANQATFDALSPSCSAGLSSACPAGRFRAFTNTRELVHTANELAGSGPTEFSLALDRRGLGFALRWTAAEEVAAQGSGATEFPSGQLANLSSRMTALRYGARGFSITALSPLGGEQLALLEAARDGRGYGGGGASADDTAGGGEKFSHLGGFLNAAYTSGQRDPTDLEDAFDYAAVEVTGGLDWRFDSGLIVGGTAGVSLSEADFDSTKSIVDGGFEADGFTMAAFAMYNAPRWYASAYVGGQTAGYEMSRFIKYPSFNPDVDSTNTVTLSETDSIALLANVAAGVPFNVGAFGVEPYLRVDAQRTTIDGFTERDATDAAFEFVIGKQEIDSVDAAAGIRASYTWTPSFGVFIPYVRAEVHRQLADDARAISAIYRSVADLANAATTDFRVPTDEADEDFYVAVAGLSSVLRGGRPDAEGVIRGGVQGFVEFRTLLEIEGVENYQVSGGLRYEF
jgi:uncharacterized protein YhjY with autotransporter beta-barrel domain